MTIDNPFASEDITPPFNDEWQAKRRVANAIKELTEALVTSSPSIEQMHGIAQKLETTASEFAASTRIYGRKDWAESGAHGNFGQISHELNPLAGWSNPLAPPVNQWVEGDVAHGSCVCGWSYEGPPGSVHGGYVAAIFDQFLGVSQLLTGQPGMTAYIKVNYHNRTPLNTELRMRTTRITVDGRKNTIHGEMYAGDTLTASAEGLFVQPRGGMRAIQTQGRED
ncbi:MAG: PaaI family thioesterase [Halioglobus sp.]|nr:PaaI family thioesterase [Halioglobus sp.]